MRGTRLTSWLAVCMLLLGCRSGGASPPKGATTNAEPSARPAATSASVAPALEGAAAAAVAVAPTAQSVTLAVRAEPASAPSPRGLEPVINEPFPEGSSDAQVCEAITDSSEQDLWLRFGHLVPMYIYGSILIIDAKERDVPRVVDLVESYHGGKYYPSIKHCSSGGVMLYLRNLADNAVGDPERGHRHLAKVLKEQLGLNTQESFTFRNDQDRLSDYCRMDAELCERLVKLDYANEGEGLCSRALSECHTGHGDAQYVAQMQKCRTLPRNLLACMEIVGESTSRDKCEAGVRKLLCPRK